MTKTVCIKTEVQNHLTGYRTAGCRCDDCKLANRVAMRKWRWRTGKVKRKLVDVQPGDGDK